MADLRGTVKRVYFTAVSLLGRERSLLQRLRKNAHILVLNLHRVSTFASPFWPPLLPEMFDELVGFLRQRVRIVTLSELDLLEPSEPAVVLSFDDGYYDFVENVVPILRSHRVRANMNVIPSCVESGNPIWNVRLYDALAAAPPSLVRELRLARFPHQLTSFDARAKARFGARITGFLKKRPQAERSTLLNEVERWAARVDVRNPTRMMRKNDVKTAAQVHEIGVHSFSHESMGFEDDAFFMRDLDNCVTYFREQLDLPLTVYAFPNGSYRQSQIDLLLSRGFRRVLLVDEKISAMRGSVLPRLTVAAANLRELRLQALGHAARGAA